MDRQGQIMQQIYNQINDMIGAGNQLFCMQFPAQPLNYRQYQYDTSDRNSVMTKPYSVQEAEFRLSNELFDISPITAGPTGEKLSVVYNTIINNFIPHLDHLAPFFRERAGLGRFLLEDSGEKHANGQPMSRIELFNKLYKLYLEKKNKWNEEKTKTLKEYEEKNDLDGYAKWLSSYGFVRQEELNNLYNDAVVRGHLHEVFTILGYLNASSIAEELELGKQKMRNSARSSLDESMTVYPVQFQPNNWFKALTPNLNPQDLTMAQDSIRDHFVAKQRELSRAKTELQQMELLSVNPEEISRIEQNIASKKQELNKAESKLIEKYGEGVVSFAKIYFNATKSKQGQPQKVDAATAEKLGAIDVSLDYIKPLQEAVEGISATYINQQNINDAISNLTELRAKKAQLESSDWKFNKVSLEQRIQELQTEVSDLGDLLANVHQANNATPNNEDKNIKLLFNKVENQGDETIFEMKSGKEITGGKVKLELGETETSDIEFGTMDNFAEKIQNAIANVSTSYKQTKVENEDLKKGNWKITIPGKHSELNIKTKESTLVSKGSPNTEQKVTQSEPSILSAPMTEADAEVSGMFTDILLKIANSQAQNETSNQTAASSSKWGFSAWFGSAGGQSSSSSANSAQLSSLFNQEMEIGFRVAKVSFDRGGWFNPHIFKMSHAFCRLAEMLVSPGLSIENIKGKNQTELKALTEYGPEGKKDKYIMPAFPVAMVIAKDITIKVKTTEETSKSAKSVVEKASSTGGGFLCFSASSASSSKNSSESTFHGEVSGYYYIRIPGPQIIGYFLQLVPQDNSVTYKPTKTDKGDSPVIQALELYNNAREVQQLAHPDVPKLQQSMRGSEPIVNNHQQSGI
jgi:hypothetical protein